MSHLLHVFPLISLHELTPITDAYQWNAHVIGNASCYRDHLLLSETPLVIGNTSCYRKHLLLSRPPLAIGNTSCYREYLLLSETPLAIERHFCQTRSVIRFRFSEIKRASARPVSHLKFLALKVPYSKAGFFKTALGFKKILSSK